MERQTSVIAEIEVAPVLTRRIGIVTVSDLPELIRRGLDRGAVTTPGGALSHRA
jgi:hypothetical protein